MKKRYLILTALLALSLAACSQEKAKNEDGSAKTCLLYTSPSPRDTR